MKEFKQDLMYIIPLIAIAAFFILLLQELDKDEPMKIKETDKQDYTVYEFRKAPIGKLVILNGDIVANMTHSQTDKGVMAYYNFSHGSMQTIGDDCSIARSKVTLYTGSITVQND